MPNNFMGMDGFVWFVGVVEDRDDPEEIGRVRVRCLGFHTEDLEQLPTADLPWAHVMHPVTDPSMQGVGNSPSFLLEGSWVIGFFRDAEEKQQPIIIGSLPGVPQEKPNPQKGFNDPRGSGSKQPAYASKKPATGSYLGSANKWPVHYYGPYPVAGNNTTLRPPLGEPDVSLLARGQKGEQHDSLKRRRKVRTVDVPVARKPTMGATEPKPSREKQKLWNEPLPRGVEAKGKKTGTREVEIDDDEYATEDVYAYQSGMYPYNHVHESEAGHIMEIDDTPGGERLYRQHMSGTMEEIHPDGKKVVVVIGDNYEIVAGKSNVVIKGDCNVTVEGSKRELIKGDYVLQVEGDYTQNIGKNLKSKIGSSSVGNKYEEILGNYAFNYKDSKKGNVGKDYETNIGGSELRVVKGSDGYTLIVSKSVGMYAQEETFTIAALEDYMDIYGGDVLSLKSGGRAHLAAAENIKIKADTNIGIDAGLEFNTKSGFSSNIQSQSSINISSGALTVGNAAGIINLNSPGTGDWEVF